MRLPLLLLAAAALALASGCHCLPPGFGDERVIIKNAQGDWEVETRKTHAAHGFRPREDEPFPGDRSLEQIAKDPIDPSKLFSQPGPDDRD